MDCDRIAENLFVGSCPLDSKDFEDLRSLGVTAIMSLQTEEDTGERGIEWEEKAALNAKLAFRNVRSGTSTPQTSRESCLTA